MFYNVLKLKDLINLNGNDLERKVLLQNGNSLIELIAIKKEEIIDTHTSTSDVMLYIIDGELELHFEAEKFKIDKGEILMFKKDRAHKVLALKDSKFMLIKI